MRITLQYPELSELGELYSITPSAVEIEEALIKTPFAFATLPIAASYLKAGEALAACGWTNLGNRYNALHGPHYISLWWKQFQHKPLGDRKNASSPYDYYSDRKGVPDGARYATNCCGLLLRDLAKWVPGDSAYLQILRVATDELPAKQKDWQLVGESASHSYLVNTQSGKYLVEQVRHRGEKRDPLWLLTVPTENPPMVCLPTVKSPAKKEPLEAPHPAPARRRKVALVRL